MIRFDCYYGNNNIILKDMINPIISGHYLKKFKWFYR